MGATLTTVSANRQTDAQKLNRSLRGELDWIVMKALEKDRSRRYETASGLARDVERYLAGDAVEAGPPSGWYRVRKFARRNRVVLTTTVLVALALIAGTTVSAWQAIVAQRVRGRSCVSAPTGSRRPKPTRSPSTRPGPERRVDEMYTEVAAEMAVAAAATGVAPDREFLLKALDFYQEFAQERGSGPESRHGAARAERNAGDILGKLGERSRAESAYRRARPRSKKRSSPSSPCPGIPDGTGEHLCQPRQTAS